MPALTLVAVVAIAKSRTCIRYADMQFSTVNRDKSIWNVASIVGLPWLTLLVDASLLNVAMAYSY